MEYAEGYQGTQPFVQPIAGHCETPRALEVAKVCPPKPISNSRAVFEILGINGGQMRPSVAPTRPIKLCPDMSADGMDRTGVCWASKGAHDRLCVLQTQASRQSAERMSILLPPSSFFRPPFPSVRSLYSPRSLHPPISIRDSRTGTCVTFAPWA